jgi:ABC-type nickel/cobalt efflux system permease component RcnA
VTVALLWATGGLEALQRQAVAGQRVFQNELAGAIRQLKAGETGAVAGLLGIAFAYGVLHAAGPGHGKMLLGSYALATRVSLVRLSSIAVTSSLAQATTAVVLVYSGVGLFDWTRERMVDLADRTLTALGYVAIGGIGLWLAWRGLRGLMRSRGGAGEQEHVHGHHHDHHEGCGHTHGPTLDEIAEVRSFRDAAVLIAGTAIRPCTGAVFLLILCWRIGADPVGIAGTYAMGLGTALVTLATALVAATIREGAWSGLGEGSTILRVTQVVQVSVGLVLSAVALSLLRPFL